MEVRSFIVVRKDVWSFMKKFFRVVTVAICLGGATASYGQVNTATVLGRVVDSSEGVIPNGRVTARNLRTGLERTATTDGNGAYELPSLAIGPYQIQVEVANFRKEVREGVVLAAGDRVRLDFTMQPGAVAESVTVTAAAPLVNASSPELGTVIDSKKVTDLPIAGRNFTQLVTLQPGVQASGVNGRQAYDLNGLTQWGLNITLDGTDASFGESQSFGDPSGRSVLAAGTQFMWQSETSERYGLPDAPERFRGISLRAPVASRGEILVTKTSMSTRDCSKGSRIGKSSENVSPVT
jgi:hypothetical protein